MLAPPLFPARRGGVAVTKSSDYHTVPKSNPDGSPIIEQPYRITPRFDDIPDSTISVGNSNSNSNNNNNSNNTGPQFNLHLMAELNRLQTEISSLQGHLQIQSDNNTRSISALARTIEVIYLSIMGNDGRKCNKI